MGKKERKNPTNENTLEAWGEVILGDREKGKARKERMYALMVTQEELEELEWVLPPVMEKVQDKLDKAYLEGKPTTEEHYRTRYQALSRIYDKVKKKSFR